MGVKGISVFNNIVGDDLFVIVLYKSNTTHNSGVIWKSSQALEYLLPTEDVIVVIDELSLSVYIL